MPTRRHLLATGSAFVFAATLSPLFAADGHGGFEPTDPDADAPVQRRWMMEDTYGNVVTNEDLMGQFVLVYFGYTRCPDVCPTTLAVVGEAMDRLGDKAEHVQPLFVTVDPDRDNAKYLREYCDYMHPSIMGLRGPKAYTDHMVKAFNARYEFYVDNPSFPDEYTVDHTASVALVGPDGLLVKRFPYGTSPDDMTADLEALIDGIDW